MLEASNDQSSRRYLVDHNVMASGCMSRTRQTQDVAQPSHAPSGLSIELVLKSKIVDGPQSPTGLTIRFINRSDKPVNLPAGDITPDENLFVRIYRSTGPNPFDPISNLREKMPGFYSFSENNVVILPNTSYDVVVDDASGWLGYVNDPDIQVDQNYAGDWCVQSLFLPRYPEDTLEKIDRSLIWRSRALSPLMHISVTNR